MEIKTNQTNYSLGSIAGYKEEKAEAIEIINLFKNFESFKSKGVSIPKGLILSGKPGVGKTLMAKVISAESKVPLYEYEASEGNTVKKSIDSIRGIYAEARKNAPSIVFIDELDELVSSRSYVSDMSRIMLKTLLTEIDGVKNSEGVLTIATTNFYDQIPPALKRSGRMDKHINFKLPDFESRVAILKLYGKDKELLKNVDFREIAGKTEKFSGADLKNLINEVLIKGISIGKKSISTSYVSDLIPTIAFKGIKRDLDKPPLDHVCYHELGHFICEYVLNKNVSTISTERIGYIEGHVSPLRHTSFSYEILSFSECKNQAVVALGGYAAEKVFLNENYTGVLDDLLKFENMIKLMASSGMFEPKYIFECNNYFTGDFYFDDDGLKMQKVEEDDIRVRCFKEYLNIAIEIIEDNKDLLEFLFNKLKKSKKIDAKNAEVLIDEFKKGGI